MMRVLLLLSLVSIFNHPACAETAGLDDIANATQDAISDAMDGIADAMDNDADGD